MAITYDEKRDFQRMPVQCDISYIIDGETEKYYGKGSDLSATAEVIRNDKEGDSYIIGVKMYDVR